MQTDLQVLGLGRSEICVFNRLPGKHSHPHGEGPQGTLCKDERGSYGIGVPGSASRDSKQVTRTGHSPPCSLVKVCV